MIRINLLPERGRRRRRLVPESGVVAVALAVIASLVGSYFYFAWQNHLVQSRTAAINREIEAIKPSVAEVISLEQQIEDLRAREGLLRSLEARELPWADLLVDLAQRTPRDAWLLSAGVEDSTGVPRLTLSGSAMSYDAVARFMNNLAASRYYGDVDLQGATSSIADATKIVQFGLITTVHAAPAQEGTR
jgi:Tfp pilus assembly protein PilN